MTEREENFSLMIAAILIFSVGLGEGFGAPSGWMYCGLALLLLAILRMVFK